MSVSRAMQRVHAQASELSNAFSTSTDGRTDGTKNMADAHTSVQLPNARTHVREIPLGPNGRYDERELDKLATVGQRFPVIRIGEREPIRWALRLAVYRRDQGVCQLCHQDVRDSEKHLDHVIPWSTGGNDLSTNLRLLCEPCNIRRSNYRDGTECRTYLPVTWWCMDCWALGMDLYDHNAAQPEGYCRSPYCGHTGNYKPEERVLPLSVWDRVDPDEPLIFAFCAHCNYNNQTNKGHLL